MFCAYIRTFVQALIPGLPAPKLIDEEVSTQYFPLEIDALKLAARHY
jgi:hypothetical protein